jgi:3-oxoacyl-[acyl-carrier protein] reductase
VGVARSSTDLIAMSPAIEAYGVRYTSEPTDLAEPAEVEALAARLLAREDELRVLVNNAGAGVGAASLLETSPDQLRRILRLNVVAPYLLIRALAPRLARVVNIGSAVGSYRIPPYTTSAAYSAAKGALGGLTRQAGRLLAAEGVAVNAVLPGDVLTAAGTEWFESLTDEERAGVLARVPRGALTSVEEIAHAVVALCADDAAAIVGVSLDVNSGAWIK